MNNSKQNNRGNFGFQPNNNRGYQPGHHNNGYKPSTPKPTTSTPDRGSSVQPSKKSK